MNSRVPSATTVAIVDDEPSVRRLVSLYLRNNGYQTKEFSSGEELIAGLGACNPGAVILDIGMPGLTGIQVTQAVREFSSVPIVIISVKDNEDSIVAALDAGADDYMVKPFSLSELGARLRASLRRGEAKSKTSQVRTAGDLVVDLATHEASLSGRRLSLTPTEYALLATLARNTGRVITHRQLLKEVWGITHHDDSHVIRVTVANLRAKLGKDIGHRLIVNEPRVGYRLATDASRGAYEMKLQESTLGQYSFQKRAAGIQRELSDLVASTNALFRALYGDPILTQSDAEAADARAERAKTLLQAWEALEPTKNLRTPWHYMTGLFSDLSGLLVETTLLKQVPTRERTAEVSRLQSLFISHLEAANRAGAWLLDTETETRVT